MKRKTHFTEKWKEKSVIQLSRFCLLMTLLFSTCFAMGTTQAQKATLTGTVVDNTNLPLPGVSVVIANTNTGVMTDLDGKYAIQVEKGDLISFSFIGFTEKTVSYTGQKEINITLSEDVQLLGEVVVTALGIKREKKALGYNVQEMKAEDINTVKSVNFVNSLSGKVAGVNIQKSSSGVGGASKVVMRGPASISQSNNVLYVIDGIPIYNSGGAEAGGSYQTVSSGEGISDLNSEDIESISVLTGASASALYGSEAGNGVILITTKKGKEGKIEVSFSSSAEFSTPLIMPNLQKRYANKPGEFSSWGNRLETPSSYDPLDDFYQLGQNFMNTVAVSTGTAKNQTYFSIGSTNANGVVPNNSYDKFNLTFRNTTTFLDDKMTFDAGINYISQKDNNMIAQGTYFNPIPAAYLFPVGENFEQVKAFERYDPELEYSTQYWPYGSQGLDLQNPFWATSRNIHASQKERYMINFSLKYQLNSWINLSTRVRMDNESANRDKNIYASTLETLAGPNGRMALGKRDRSQFYADLMATFNRHLSDDVQLIGILGSSLQKIEDKGSQIIGDLNQVPNHFTINNIDRTNDQFKIIQQMFDRNNRQALFGSAEFSYKNYMYLTLTAREEWASELAINPNQPSASHAFFYPSVGLSLLVSDMVELPEVVSFLKLRGSYAETGVAPTSLYAPTHQYNVLTGVLEKNPVKVPDELHEERTHSYELGMNVRFLENKFNLDVSLYNAETKNQTFEVDIDAFSGYQRMVVQAGSVVNKGIEASLGYYNTWNNLKWNTQLIYTLNKNRIKKLVQGLKDPVTGEDLSFTERRYENFASYERILKEGGSVGDIYTTKDLARDHNGNIYVDPGTGVIHQIEKRRKVGSTLPKYNLSWRNDFSYKDFSLGALLTARVGGEVISVTQSYLDLYGVSEATALDRDNGGTMINGGRIPAVDYYSIAAGPSMLSNYVYSATNARLEELSVGYNIPSKWVNNLFHAKISFVARNLFMIYNKAPFDPEKTISTGNAWQGIDFFAQPSTRSIGFNLNVKF